MRTDTAKIGEQETTTIIDDHVALDRAISRTTIDLSMCEDESVRVILVDHLNRLLKIELEHMNATIRVMPTASATH